MWVAEHGLANRTFSGKTENVARLTFRVDHLKPGLLAIDIDGHKAGEIPWPADRRLRLHRDAGKWGVAPPLAASEKGPHRHGPFLHAFNHRFLFVVATKGTVEENAWALAKARFDAERFWYQGNGSIDIVKDTDLASAIAAGAAALADPSRSVILFGNAETNAAWPLLLDDSPVQIHRDRIEVRKYNSRGDNRTTFGDDLACIFVRPRRGSDVAMVAVVGGTGLSGCRLSDRLTSFFTSRAGYPDWMIVSADMLDTGKAGGTAAVRAVGYFGNDWGVSSGEMWWQPGRVERAEP